MGRVYAHEEDGTQHLIRIKCDCHCDCGGIAKPGSEELLTEWRKEGTWDLNASLSGDKGVWTSYYCGKCPCERR